MKLAVDHSNAILDSEFDYCRTSHERRVASALRLRRARKRQRQEYIDEGEEEEEFDIITKTPQKKRVVAQHSALSAMRRINGNEQSENLNPSSSTQLAPTPLGPFLARFCKGASELCESVEY